MEETGPKILQGVGWEVRTAARGCYHRRPRPEAERPPLAEGGVCALQGVPRLRGPPRSGPTAAHPGALGRDPRLTWRPGTGGPSLAPAQAWFPPREAQRPPPAPASRAPRGAGLVPSARLPARSPRPGPHSRSTSCSLARSSSSLPLRLSASLFSDARVWFSCSPSVAIFAPGRGGEGSAEPGCG